MQLIYHPSFLSVIEMRQSGGRRGVQLLQTSDVLTPPSTRTGGRSSAANRRQAVLADDGVTELMAPNNPAQLNVTSPELLPTEGQSRTLLPVTHRSESCADPPHQARPRLSRAQQACFVLVILGSNVIAVAVTIAFLKSPAASSASGAGDEGFLASLASAVSSSLPSSPIKTRWGGQLPAPLPPPATKRRPHGAKAKGRGGRGGVGRMGTPPLPPTPTVHESLPSLSQPATPQPYLALPLPASPPHASPQPTSLPPPAPPPLQPSLPHSPPSPPPTPPLTPPWLPPARDSLSLAQSVISLAQSVTGSSPAPPLLNSPPSPPHEDRIEENAADVGVWGGTCTCPSGVSYQVGDHFDFCASLACIGGATGPCHKEVKRVGVHGGSVCIV